MGYYSEDEGVDNENSVNTDTNININIDINENSIIKDIIHEIYPNSIIENIQFIGRGNSGAAYEFNIDGNTKIIKIYKNDIGYDYPKLTQSKYYDVPEIHKCRLTTCAIMPYDKEYILLDKWDFSNINHNDIVIWKIIFNLIHSVYDLHKNNTFHRDITCSNILIHKNSYEIKFIDMDTSCVGDENNNDCNDDVEKRYNQNDYYANDIKYSTPIGMTVNNIISSDIDWHATAVVVLDILGHNTKHDQPIKEIIKGISKNDSLDLDDKIREYTNMIFRNCANHKEDFQKFYEIIIKPCLDVKIKNKQMIIENNINEFDIFYHDKLEKPSRCVIIRNRNAIRNKVNDVITQKGGLIKKLYIANKTSYLYL